MGMDKNTKEELLLHSFDAELSTEEKAFLEKELAADWKLKQAQQAIVKIRELLAAHQPESFGAFFAERVANRIRSFHQNVEYQLFAFFKRYQGVAIGLVIALLVINVVFADSFSLQSILGLENETINDLVQLDLYNGLIK